ncbi:MAG: efflux RND transporter periplasmic adaptor subunit [Bryobacteraceae bacterium]|nr:efflux RND transporter periplasmic adaptor subunit [Bryobacteraceae bacterium]
MSLRPALLIGLGFLLVIAGCDKKASPTAAASAPVPVIVTPVVQKSVPVYSEFTARTDAEQTVEVRARVRAVLDKQHFQEGALVTKGALLFTLDCREYEAQLSDARARLAKAEADRESARDRSTVQTSEANLEVALARLGQANQDVARLKPLAEQQAVPQQDYDNALARQKGAQADVEAAKANLNTTKVNQRTSIETSSAGVESAKALLEQAQLNVSYCRITAPITGIIGQRLVSPGNLVGGGEATLLASISALDEVRVSFAIAESEYLELVKRYPPGSGRKSPDLQLILADGSVFPHKGRVLFADRAVDERTGTLALIAQFENPGAVLRPGQFGRVRLPLLVEENALLVPQRAVMDQQSAKIVFVVGPENKVQLRTVTLGERSEDNYIIKDGLKSGEQVIVEGQMKARPGSTVIPTAKRASL